MNESELFALVELFCQRSFDLGMARRTLGAPVESSLPDRVTLTPIDPRFRHVDVELLQPAVGPGTAFVAGLVIELREPAVLHFDQLTRRFGPPTMMPRLKPHQDVPYRFMLKGADYEGYMLLNVPVGSDGDARHVRSVIIRRFPPEAR